MKVGISTNLSHILPKPAARITKLHNVSAKASVRLKWIDYINQGNSILKASRHFDIPESTIRYWYKRFKKYNLNSLDDQSKKPHHLRHCNVPYSLKAKVIDLRIQYPGWGKKILQVLLQKQGISIGQSRIQLIINQARLKRITNKRSQLKRANRKHMYSVPKEYLTRPGGLVYMDVKHLGMTGSGSRMYQFTALDHATRILKLKVFRHITSDSCVEFLKYIRREFPFQEIMYIGTDNGSEFLGSCEQYLKEENIQHVFSSPRSPKQNPFVERVIRTVIDDVYSFQGTQISVDLQQLALEEYVFKYNYVRPHSSLGYLTPLEKYATLTCADSLTKNSQHLPNQYNSFS